MHLNEYTIACHFEMSITLILSDFLNTLTPTLIFLNDLIYINIVEVLKWFSTLKNNAIYLFITAYSS